jgi:hypothetical protein
LPFRAARVPRFFGIEAVAVSPGAGAEIFLGIEAAAASPGAGAEIFWG